MKGKNIIFSVFCFTLCLLLLLLTSKIPQIDNTFSLIHIPVLICGFIYGWLYGLTIGVVAPLVICILFKIFPIFPTGIIMLLELGTYGLVSGVLYDYFQKNTITVFITLIISMLAGRIVWGITTFIFSLINKNMFTFNMFIQDVFINKVPGIVVQIIVVPIVVIMLEEARKKVRKRMLSRW